MSTQLSTFAEIISGYNFRSAIEPNDNGDTYIVQAKNISSDETLSSTQSLTKISFSAKETNTFLKKNDILIVSRGTWIGSFRATLSTLEDVSVIAANSVIIIRIKAENIQPGYISLYLNSEEGQKKILETLSWWTIHAISPWKFKEIEIPIIPLKQQNLIYHLHQNLLEQKRIQNRKYELYSQIISSSLKQLTLS